MALNPEIMAKLQAMMAQAQQKLQANEQKQQKLEHSQQKFVQQQARNERRLLLTTQLSAMQATMEPPETESPSEE
jgi:septal ring factor EnvC (AmiA/AmiB activator)